MNHFESHRRFKSVFLFPFWIGVPLRLQVVWCTWVTGDSSQFFCFHFELEFLYVFRLFDVHIFVSNCKLQSIYYLKGQYMSNKMIATGWTGIVQIHHEVVLQRCCRGFTGVRHHATRHFQPPDYLARGCSSTLQLQHGYHAHWQQKVSGTLTF